MKSDLVNIVISGYGQYEIYRRNFTGKRKEKLSDITAVSQGFITSGMGFSLSFLTLLISVRECHHLKSQQKT